MAAFGILQTIGTFVIGDTYGALGSGMVAVSFVFLADYSLKQYKSKHK